MEIPRPPDDELVARARRGDEDAFAVLVGRYKDRVASYLHGMLRDRDAALDLAQESFLRLYRHLPRYRPEGKFATFLFTIASNAARDALKARRRAGILYLSEYREVLEGAARLRAPDPPSTGLEREDVRRTVSAGLARLPAVYREALLLRETEDLPYEEIARVAGCSVGTAKSRVSRARVAFRAAVERQERSRERSGMGGA